jgi:hypothetical protein
MLLDHDLLYCWIMIYYIVGSWFIILLDHDLLCCWIMIYYVVGSWFFYVERIFARWYNLCAFAKFRCGVAPLRIETGWFENLRIEERICCFCSDFIEDETHVLVNCQQHNKSWSNNIINHYLTIVPYNKQHNTVHACDWQLLK